MDVQTFFNFLVLGVTAAAVYSISATGLVVTYITSGVFNFAHGAIGMFLAFVYWQLRVQAHMPIPLAMAITLLVVAPAIGVALDVLVMRRLVKGASVATKLVVTLALLFMFQGLALAGWPTKLRQVPPLWGDNVVTIGSVNINYDQLTTVAIAIGVAFALRLLFTRTRIGIAMRAVVDNPELCAIKGISPNRVTAVSWALGSMLAGLAAILIAPGLTLEVNVLSLLVVNAYCAVVYGRLQSLPATFVGALILGISQNLLVGFLPQTNEIVRNLKSSMPFLLLVVALLVRPEKRLPEKVPTHGEPKPPKARSTWGVGGAAVLGAVVVSGLISPYSTLIGAKAMVFACVALSLTLLTGLSGQVSLMHLSFVGAGAVLLGRIGDRLPYPIAVLVVGLVIGLLGCLVALPAIRLRGIYLALLTLGFAILMDNMFFGNLNVLGGGTTIAVPRPSFFGIGFKSDRAVFVLAAITLAVFANVFLIVRRSPFGRMLSAVRDAPNACSMIGMNITSMKLRVFGISAFLAGTAGALLGSLQVRVGALDFLYFRSLTLLLVATIFGISSVSGALLGAFFFVLLPEVLTTVLGSSSGGSSASQALQPLIIGVLAMVVARRPEGVAGIIRNRLRPLWERSPRVRSLASREEVSVASA